MSLHVFDLDRTLATGNCSFQFGVYLYKRGYLATPQVFLSAVSYALHCMKILSLRQTHFSIFNWLFKGRSMKEIEDLSLSFVNMQFSKMIYPPALQRLITAQKLGKKTVILSSSPQFLVAPIAALLNVSRWESSYYAVDQNQKFSHISRVIEGNYKAEYVKKLSHEMGVGKADITIYTDSFLDSPMFQEAGKIIGVNPDRCLKNYCKKAGCEVI